MKRRENIYYVIEALAYLGGVGDPEDVYNKAGELFPQSIIKSYPDAGAFDEVVRKAVDDCLDSAAGKKVFKRNPAGKLVFKEPYARLARRVREGINPRETIRLWWYMGYEEFCAVTDKCVYFLSVDPNPVLIRGSVNSAKVILNEEWMTIILKSLNGITWEIGSEYDEVIFALLKETIFCLKTLIVCESYHHKNTLKVASRMAAELYADLLPAGEVDDIEKYDLVGFGSGIYFNKHHRRLRELVEKLNLKDKRVFVFSTSGIGFKCFNRGLIRKLRKKGAVIVGSFACRGYDTFGILKKIGGIARERPNERDLKKAEAFARDLLRADL